MQIGDLVEEALASPDELVQDIGMRIVFLAEKLEEELDRAARPPLYLVG